MMGMAGVLWGASRLLTVRSVECTLNGDVLAADARVCTQLQSLRGTALLFHNWRKDVRIAEALFIAETQESFSLQSVEKSLSGVVVLHLTDSPPVYRIETAEGLALISEAGGRQASSEHVRVPLVRDEGGIYESNQGEVHAFLTVFLQALGTAQERVKTITLWSYDFVSIELAGFPRVLVEIRQPPERAASRLVLLLGKISPREIDLGVRELDLRFELPVLRSFESSPSAVTIDSLE